MTNPEITITGPIAKGYTPSSNVRTTYEVLASFCPIQLHSDGMSYVYSKELVTVAPFAPLEDGCLVVLGTDSNYPVIAKWGKGRGGYYSLTFGSGDRCSHTKNDLGDGYHILGRVVGPDRVFPRQEIVPAPHHAA